MRKTDNLTPSCAVVMNSGNLNFLEPSGPLQASNGTALPFIFDTFYKVFNDCSLLITGNNHLRKHFNFINFSDFVTSAYVRKDSLKTT